MIGKARQAAQQSSASHIVLPRRIGDEYPITFTFSICCDIPKEDSNFNHDK
jgi:hypothetical protein